MPFESINFSDRHSLNRAQERLSSVAGTLDSLIEGLERKIKEANEMFNEVDFSNEQRTSQLEGLPSFLQALNRLTGSNLGTSLASLRQVERTISQTLNSINNLIKTIESYVNQIEEAYAEIEKIRKEVIDDLKTRWTEEFNRVMTKYEGADRAGLFVSSINNLPHIAQRYFQAANPLPYKTLLKQEFDRLSDLPEDFKEVDAIPDSEGG